VTVIKKATFIIEGKDDTKKATDSAKRNVKSAAREMGRSMQSAALVTDRTGARLSAFNERTEKMRQLLSATGTAAGGAAGEIAFYGGTMAAVVGKFGVAEIAILGVGAAIAGMGLAITAVLGPLNDAQEELKKTTEETNKLRIANEKLLEKMDLVKLGFTEFDFTIVKAKQKRTELQLDLAKLQTRLVELSQSNRLVRDVAFTLGEFGETVDGIKKARNEIELLNAQIKEMEERAEIKKLPALVGITEETETERKARVKRFEDRQKERERDLGIARDVILMREAQEAKERLALAEHDRRKKVQRERALNAEAARLLAHHDHLADLEASARKKRLDAERKEAEELKKIQEEQLRAREQSIKNALDLAQQSVNISGQIGDMFDLWGVSAAKSEKEREKAEAKRIATLSAINMALELARAAAAYARYDFVAGAGHTLAVALYAATLGKALAGAAGGGAGAAGGAGGGAGRTRTPADLTTRDEAEDLARQAVVINVFGHQFFDTRDADRAIFEGNRNFQNNQQPGRDQGRF
jgi:hypothetical protein